ncbi:MAG: nitrilase-related carbon-nitrogen hydrolase [bacterium]
MKIAIVQYAPLWENPEGSIEKLNFMLNKITDEECIIFPEMTLTGFTMNTTDYANEIDGEMIRYFMTLSAKMRKNVFAGVIEKSESRHFNTLFHFDTSGLIMAEYRKMHPFSFSKEDQHYFRGDEPVITMIDHVKIGLSVCYDLRFPELYRFYGKARAEAMINIANWPVPRINHWLALLKARAIENQCFMIGVNRVGSDPYNQYNGRSAVFDPMGNEILVCDDLEDIFRVDLDIALVKETRDKFPFLDDIKLI